MDLRPHPRTSAPGRLPYHCFFRLGRVVRQVSHVSQAYCPGASYLDAHPHHNLHQRRQFLLDNYVLADAELQRKLLYIKHSTTAFAQGLSLTLGYTKVYGHNPVDVGIRGIPVGFSIMVGAVIVLFLLSIFRGANRVLMIVSSVLMTAGCGAMAVGRVDNMYQLWGILVLAGLGIGGIVVPASIITMIICPDDLIATVAALTLSIRVIGGSIGYCIYCKQKIPGKPSHVRVPHMQGTPYRWIPKLKPAAAVLG